MEVDDPVRFGEGDDVGTLTALGSTLINAILDGEALENIRTIVEAGAPLWYQDEAEGLSPLHAAAYVGGGDKDIIKFLIDEGAVWNAGTLFLDPTSAGLPSGDRI